MIAKVLGIGSLIVIGTGLSLQQQPQNDAALMKVQREIWEVWFAGDTARVRALTPGLVAISPGGGTWSDQETVVRGSAQFHARGGQLIQLEFPQMKVQRFGDVAIVYTTYLYVTVVGTDTSRQAGRASEVFVKRNGKWVNPGWHMDSGS